MTKKGSFLLLTAIVLICIAYFLFRQEEPIETKNIPIGMILVPGGTTQIGSTSGTIQEVPVHHQNIKAFLMDVHPVTVAEFRKFVEEANYTTSAEQFGNSGVFDYKTGRWYLKDGANWEFPQGPENPKAADNHPVTQVSWYDAEAYSKWAGKRLPTEMEWEHAARNGGKINEALYPWGTNKIKQGDEYLANVWQGVFPLYNNEDDGYRDTSPVGSFKASPLGLFDMAGNVWEWCSNWKMMYDNEGPFEPGLESEKVQRGGSFLCDTKVCHGYRVSARSGSTPETSLMNVGFRCVKDFQD